ncbi:MAG TPA: hypothetical protein VKB79_23095 [Bryobacteraceae bacterium]|nr:hypothetical protein [Bryobacteraceae bacterium]
MSFYPQIASGAIAQFPVRRARQWRAIANQMESGEQILLPDADGGQIGWDLRYVDLSDSEATALTNLFASCSGSYAWFTFIDPMANLFGWSEDLTRSDWQTGLLTTSYGANDPLGTQRATTIVNGQPGAQPLIQSVSMPGDYAACLSAWIRSDVGGNITLGRDNIQSVVAAPPAWTRVYLSVPGIAGATESTFSIALQARQSIDIWGLQVEAQPYPSPYKQTAAARGIYDETYFANDDLTVTSTAPGLSSCAAQLISRV